MLFRSVKGFDFDVAKAEQIFDLLLKEKQLKLPENHKLPTAQELQGRLYCKWHHSFTHATGECKELRRQINSGSTHDEGRHEALPTSQRGRVVRLHSYGPEFFIPDQHGGTHAPP